MTPSPRRTGHLARNAQRLFAEHEPREKRRLLNFLLSNCTWEDGEVVATFRQPFDMLAETAANSNRLESGVTFKAAKTEIWLGMPLSMIWGGAGAWITPSRFL